MQLYLVRHGETLFNQRGLMQGWCDSPLSDLGIHQAKCVGYGLKDIDFVAAYCSTSERTLDTAMNIIGDRDLTPTPLKGLKEINFGTFEGTPMNDRMFARFEDPNGFKDVGGETTNEAATRAVDTWYRIATKHPDGKVLIVTHGGVIMNGLRLLDKQVDEYLKQGKGAGNCSVSILEVENSVMTLKEYCSQDYLAKGEENGIS